MYNIRFVLSLYIATAAGRIVEKCVNVRYSSILMRVYRAIIFNREPGCNTSEGNIILEIFVFFFLTTADSETRLGISLNFL